MFSRLLSKLPVSRLADWGFDLSVGIALSCESRDCIVMISDQKVTLSEASADNAALKGRRLFSRCWAIEVGDDAEFAPIILGETAALLSERNKPGNIVHPATVVEALDEVFWKHIHAKIERTVLRKYKFTVDSFREQGKTKCTASVYNNLCAKIEKTGISLEFLVAGFDSGGKAHIFVVDGKDSPRCYTQVGVWAVGSGAHAALSSLFFQIDKRRFNPLWSTAEQACYFACEAKFMAEASGHVGREGAALSVFRSVDLDKRAHLIGSAMQEIKSIWLKKGAPRVPKGIEQEISSRFFLRPDDPWKD
jgi:hypothetical protein